MYPEFLSLCGFEPEEIEREAPRIDKAFEILEIGPDDVNQATKRIAGSYDIELLSIRKGLGMWLKELIDMVLAKEEGKKIIYASVPPFYQVMAAMASASEDIYCVIPEAVLSFAMNLFGKINPILETAEMHGLAPGLAFCSLLQTRLGAITKGIIPMPDLLVPSCLMCDQSPKVDELLHEVYGVPVTYIDHIFDSGGDQWPDVISSQRVQYLASQVEDAMDKFRQLFGYQVTEMEVRQPLDAESEIFRTQVEVWELMKVDPMPLRFKDLSITLGPTSWSRRAVREEAEVLNILRKELEKRVKDGVGVVERGAPRVMASMLPMDSAIQGMFEELGLAIPVSSLVPIPTAGRDMNSFSSVWEEVANSIITRRGANYSGLAYLLQVKQLAKLQNVDGVVLFHHVGCRQYNTWLPKAKEVIEKELGIPSLILEGDYCDFRDYNAKQMRTRLETFAQVVKTAKASREGAR